MFKRKAKSEENVKVKNATKHVYNDIKFDSGLELFFYKQLVANEIPFEMKVTYEIQPKFKYAGTETIRPITYTPDYVIPSKGLVIDTKGFATDVFKIKLKMLKKMFHDTGYCYTILLPSNQKQCLEIIYRIKNNEI